MDDLKAIEIKPFALFLRSFDEDGAQISPVSFNGNTSINPIIEEYFSKHIWFAKRLKPPESKKIRKKK